MATVKATASLANNSASTNNEAPSFAGFAVPSVGKAGRISKRARSFRNIIGRAEKIMRGRIGGEMPKDERYYERRDEKLSRVVARQRSEQHFTREQLRLVDHDELAFA